MDSLEDGLDFFSSFTSSDQPLDSDVLSDSFRDLLAFTTPPIADPCTYSATISSLSHNRLAKEATALLKSYSLRGIAATVERDGLYYLRWFLFYWLVLFWMILLLCKGLVALHYSALHYSALNCICHACCRKRTATEPLISANRYERWPTYCLHWKLIPSFLCPVPIWHFTLTFSFLFPSSPLPVCPCPSFHSISQEDMRRKRCTVVPSTLTGNPSSTFTPSLPPSLLSSLSPLLHPSLAPSLTPSIPTSQLRRLDWIIE